jgi:hypothetical protein
MNPLFTEAHMERSITEMVNLLRDKNDAFEYPMGELLEAAGIDVVMSHSEAFRFLKYLVSHKWMIYRMSREWGVTQATEGQLYFWIKSEGDRGPAKNPTLDHTFRRGRTNQKRSFNRSFSR